MTVSTEISSNEYTGNGVTTDFDYKFRIFKANQLSVITSDADRDNVVTLRLGTDYTVTGANKSAGGKVILTKPLANGHKISIARDIPITQETSFRNQSKFFAETHEDAFDYLTMIIQRIWGSLGSLYLKRPNVLANWFDAKGYRIANLGKPKRDSDAVDLGTLKDEISGVNSTILKREKRLLRVDDMDISALPKSKDRANKVLTFDASGQPQIIAPASGSAIDVINQIEEINGKGTISSIARTKYIRSGSFLNGFEVTKMNECFKYNDFYYAVKKDSSLPIMVEQGSAPNSDWICVGNATMPIGSHSLFDFGCVDDNGITDNRLNIQRAIEYMEWCKSELYTDSSADNKYFGINSFHPLYPAKHCLIITNPRNINIYGGRDRNSSIKYTGSVSGSSLIELIAARSDWGMSIERLGISAGNKLDYVISGVDVWYAQNDFNGGCYEEAVLDGIHVSMYMSSFKRVFTNNNGQDGFAFGGPLTDGGFDRGTSTSLSLIDCWSRASGRHGYSVSNELWYSEWSSCGCDGLPTKRTQIGYYLKNAKGVVLSGIGAEQTEKLMKVDSFRGLTVNGMQMSNAGSTTTTLDYCIELGGGFDATFSGFAPVNQFDDKYEYLLYVSNATGNESVVLLDHSIISNKIGFKKANPEGYYRYPEIFSFAVGRSQDRGFQRNGNVLHVGSGTIVTPTLTGIQDTIINRDFIVRTVGKQNVSIFSTTGNNFTAVIDITEVTKTGTKSAVARQWVSSKVNGSISLHGSMGAPQSDWAFDNSLGGGVIGVTDNSPDVIREFIVSVRFTSTDGSGISFNF
ncbi:MULTISPECIES: hypothetical protein [unclassified Providencia]|uniref:hypothetical protein n=1 Tax=unclassified Providencia TaxID=2633465 RepID=UPI0023491BFC|nr:MULTISPECIES: hypothetical protein [unclassified Providencia]